MISRRWPAAVAAAVATALIATACTGGSDGRAGESGAASPATLTMANPSSNILRYPAVAQFVARFKELSPGRPVTVVDRWGDFAPDNEQRVVRDVAAGRADLGWVGTHVLDTLGVQAFQAVNAPMLVDGYELQQAVVDSDMSREMLGHLDQAGVHGLALLAGELRKPVSVQHPFVRLADWRGARFGSLRSGVQRSAIEALGATVQEVQADSRRAALSAGGLDAFELSLHGYQFNSLEAAAPHIAGNVDLWPEMMVLIVNPDRFRQLSGDDRARLEQAARETAKRSAALSGGDSAILAQECQLGTRVGLASASELTELRNAFAPVYSKLSEDPDTKRYIAAIEELKRGIPAPAKLAVPDGCLTGQTGAAATPAPVSNPLIGTWEAATPHPYWFQVTADLWIQLERHSDGTSEQGWRGTYTVAGSTVRLTEIGAGCRLEYQVTRQADELRIKVLSDEPADNPECGPNDLLIARFIYETAPFHKTA